MNAMRGCIESLKGSIGENHVEKLLVSGVARIAHKMHWRNQRNAGGVRQVYSARQKATRAFRRQDSAK